MDMKWCYELLTVSERVYGVHVVMTIKKQDCIDRPFQYVSNQLGKSQRAWTPIVKEALVIIFAMKKLRPYV